MVIMGAGFFAEAGAAYLKVQEGKEQNRALGASGAPGIGVSANLDD
ncbi:MAG: hypothetical protein QMC04_07675 [Ilumatobacter sp.]